MNKLGKELQGNATFQTFGESKPNGSEEEAFSIILCISMV